MKTQVNFDSIGGGSSKQMESCAGHYTSSTFYKFTLVNSSTLECKSKDIYFTSSASYPDDEISGQGLKVKRTNSHEFTFTAINDWYLYEIGVASGGDSHNVISYGKNASCVISTFQSNTRVLIATSEEITEV